MTTIVDTMEAGDGPSHRWASYWPADVRVVRSVLKTGDVAPSALPDKAVVERKAAPDFLAAVGRERERFDRRSQGSRYIGWSTNLVKRIVADVLMANCQRMQLCKPVGF